MVQFADLPPAARHEIFLLAIRGEEHERSSTADSLRRVSGLFRLHTAVAVKGRKREIAVELEQLDSRLKKAEEEFVQEMATIEAGGADSNQELIRTLSGPKPDQGLREEKAKLQREKGVLDALDANLDP